MTGLFTKKSDIDIEALTGRIERALSGPALRPETVIAACERLSWELAAPKYLAMLEAVGLQRSRAEEEISTARGMLGGEYLKRRLGRELGSEAEVIPPAPGQRPVRLERRPLGVLLHISAGNADALPAFSVIEGLLTGNVNLLKLPRGDNGVSAVLLSALCAIEPALSPFIEVFDIPSGDADLLEKLAALSDAVAVWGGDEAVKAARRLAPPGVKVIEWGHRISFAYASPDADDEALSGIAHNICATDQLFCSSCQGIFADTDDFGEVCRFAERFAGVLEKTAEEYPKNDLRVTAQKTLEAYTEELEGGADRRVIRKDGCCVIAYNDSLLRPAYGFKSCWVRPLPRDRILPALRPYRGRLQTVGLAVSGGKEETASLLIRAGALRITDGRSMSEVGSALPHDGEWPLQRYTRVVSIEV